MKLQALIIHGINVDTNGRCIHYYKNEDIIANKCYQCKQYYSCFECHNQIQKHLFQAYHVNLKQPEKIILCGNCQIEFSYQDYIKGESSCINCHHPFNSKCKLHIDIYFKIL